MNNKIDQWARYSCNSMMQIKDYTDLECAIESGAIIKNTPQELIQADDLVVYIYGIRKVYNIIRNKITVGVNKYIYTNDVIKILTPNSNGGYDLQWEAK